MLQKIKMISKVKKHEESEKHDNKQEQHVLENAEKEQEKEKQLNTAVGDVEDDPDVDPMFNTH